MNKLTTLITIVIFVTSTGLASIDCPNETSYHQDLRTMLPDGSPNPTYLEVIPTGQCACISFDNSIDIDGNDITFTINIVDNEPIRGIELDIHNDMNFDDLSYSSISGGEKLQGLVNDQGNQSSMTILGNSIDNYVKVLVYSVSRARTSGNGEEGSLVHLTYTLAEGATLPENISFHFSVVNIPGTSLNPELLNVACSYPSADDPVTISTTTASLVDDGLVPKSFALFQNYPNPFNPSTQISFDVPNTEYITLRIYNLLGQDVKTLVSKIMNPGKYSFEWDGTDIINNDAASGVYFYELRGESFISRKKMLLIR